ncbi:MAG: dephospho-CoA kinase [Lachnospiraceae bacterium]|nr:dephospho-CoA kinase [Lachnospiraceae bacterium]
MKVLGITGGVGSGKSRILYDIEREYGAYIVEADKLAHRLMEHGMSIYNAVCAEFGKGILQDTPPYDIDRKKLGEIVFHDRDSLEKLNKISHPLVKEHIISLIEQKKNEGSCKLFVIEAALLLEDGYKNICDEIWYIWVDTEERINRLIKQRGYTRQKCMDIFSSQSDDEYYKKYADYTINNQLDYDNSSKQLKARLNKFLCDDIIT